MADLRCRRSRNLHRAETRTNTPLQALDLMNDITYVEARQTAERMMTEGGSKPEDRIRSAFRLGHGAPGQTKRNELLRETFRTSSRSIRRNRGSSDS